MRHDTSWSPVPEAPTRPMRPRRTALAKPRGTPSRMAVPQSGPMTKRFFFTASRFSSTSSATGTLSLKMKTWSPRLSAFSASAVA